MKRKLLVISVLMVVILLLGLSTSALASDQADIDISYVEDSGDYVRVNPLLPENAEDTEYHCDLYLRYGWLGVEADGSFRYELDVDNADIVAAREFGWTLTEQVAFRYRDEGGAAQLLTVRFVIHPQGADAPADSYALVNDGAAAVAEGPFFVRDDTQSEEKTPELLGILFAGYEYLTDDDLMLRCSLINGSRATQQLAAGEQRTRLLKFRLRADDGSTITRVVRITVSGVNDVPSVRSATRVLTLGGESDVSGSALTGSTLGDGTAAQHRFKWTTAASAAQYGAATLEDDGRYTYELDEDNATVRGLTENSAPLTEVFTYTYTDKDGSKVEGSVTFTVAYQDISPRVVNQTATLTEDAGVDNDDPCYVFSGNALTGSVPGNGTVAQHTFAWTDTAASDYGTVELYPDGSFSFRMNNASASVQDLYPGVDVQQTYGYTYTDAEGDEVSGSVIVTLKGANDFPRLNSFTHSFTEDVGVSDSNPIYTVDGNALVGADSGDGALTMSRFAWSTDSDAKYGEMTGNADGSYTYQLNNDSRAVQALEAGETANDVLAYTYTDANGDRAFGSVTVTVTGVNDVPTVDAKNAELSLDKTCASGDALENSTLGDGSKAEHSFVWTAGAIAAAENALYGTMTLKNDGEYKYELDENNTTVRGLTGNSDPLTEVFTYTYTDKDGSKAEGRVTVSIKYANISPIVTNAVLEITEDGTDEGDTTLTGNVLTDCTLGNGYYESHFFSWVAGSSEAKYGTVTLNSDGTYSYMLNTAACQSMKAGEEVFEVFGFIYKDVDDDAAESGSLTIKITGVNDAPVWKGDEKMAYNCIVPANEFITVSPVMKAADIDEDDLFFVFEPQGSNTYGTLTNKNFYPNEENAAIMALTNDATVQMIFDVYISDGTDKVHVGTITFTISAAS